MASLTSSTTQSPESAEVLGEHKEGWFGPTGMGDLMKVANAPLGTSMKFEEMYICDPTAKHYGFKSWDGKNSLTHQSLPPKLTPIYRLLHPPTS